MQKEAKGEEAERRSHSLVNLGTVGILLVGGLDPATNRDLMGFNRDLYITIVNGIS